MVPRQESSTMNKLQFSFTGLYEVLFPPKISVTLFFLGVLTPCIDLKKIISRVSVILMPIL